MAIISPLQHIILKTSSEVKINFIEKIFETSIYHIIMMRSRISDASKYKEKTTLHAKRLE